ncbi:MAG: HAMP domain-containing protein [Acidobacteria bacterium]|nr:HAMP domain-containing protein [Acidobacteriota bacterium]
MRFRSLRARLLGVQSVLVVGLTVATLTVVSVLANRAVGDRISSDLERSRNTVVAAEGERAGQLRLVAELVASFPDLRALFGTDEATIRDFLASYLQTHGRRELLLALDTSGRVVARTDTFAPLALPDIAATWIEPTLRGQPAGGYFTVDGRPFQGQLAAAVAGGTVFGFVMAAAPVDDDWASALKKASEQEIVILSTQGVAGSTLPRAQLPWRTSADFGADTGSASPLQVSIDGERYQAVGVASEGASPIRVVSLRSIDRALAPYRSIQLGLLLMGLVAAAAGIAGSAVFARSLTAPIGQLVQATERVTAGHYDVTLPVTRQDELGALAGSFNTMTAGLRERADMEKFMSHSTVEMIHRGATPAERHRGERCAMTVLFSDIRGFTSFAEQRAPEDTVTLLNEYLHLQADIVKRFGGDIDKFMGDAVFAQFTGPDMALNAIRSAVEIQRAVANATAADPTRPPLAVGIGIATGDVVVGSIGSDDRLDHTAIGAPVNLGSRLCSAAEPHEVLMSEATYQLVRDLVAAEPVPPMSVKGISAAVQAYRMKRS